MNIGTVSARYFQSAWQTCLTSGCEYSELIEHCNLSGINIMNPLFRPHGSMMIDLLHAAEAILEKKGIGIDVGQDFKPKTFRDIGYGSMFCDSIIGALNFNEKYQRLTQEIGRTHIEVRGDEAAIVWTPFSDDTEYMRPITDAVFGGYFTIGTWMTWIQVKNFQSKVSFRHGPVPYADEFSVAFGCEINFNASENSLTIPTSLAKAELPQRNTSMVRLISSRLDEALVQYGRSANYVTRTYDCLEALLPRGTPSIVQVADLIGLTERTLRRKLDAEGTSFRQILENVRRLSCEILMRDSKMTLSEVAQRLGYSEQSAFSRAFKKWYGKTPKNYFSEGD